MTHHLVDDNLDPYALRAALGRAIKVLEIQGETGDARTLERVRGQLRPPADECAGYWDEQVGIGLYRQHRVMVISHDCGLEGGWERIVWPDEAQDALALHMRQAHPEDDRHVDLLRAHGRFRRNYITTGRVDG